MDLKTIYESLQVSKELAVLEPSEIEPRLRAGMEGKIRQARSDLALQEQLYKNTAVKNAVIIGVSGPYGRIFADISEKKFKTVAVDFLAVVDEMAESILKRGGKDSYSSHEHFMAMDELNKIKMKYNISQLPVFQGKFDRVGPNTSIARALCLELTAQYGGQLYSAVSRGKIADKAYDIGFTGNKLPVVLYNYAIDLDSSMLPEPVSVLDINEVPTENEVKDVLISIRNNLK
jgi:hypothetical protein